MSSLSEASSLRVVPPTEKSVEVRKIKLPDYDGKGTISITLISEKHPVFGEYAIITSNSANPPKIKTPFSHLQEVIDFCVKKNEAITSIMLPDYHDSNRLHISMSSETDLEDKEKLLVFGLKATAEELYKVAQHTLRIALGKLKEAHEERLTDPAAE